jgi:hypothetical protein
MTEERITVNGSEGLATTPTRACDRRQRPLLQSNATHRASEKQCGEPCATNLECATNLARKRGRPPTRHPILLTDRQDAAAYPIPAWAACSRRDRARCKPYLRGPQWRNWHIQPQRTVAGAQGDAGTLGSPWLVSGQPEKKVVAMLSRKQRT